MLISSWFRTLFGRKPARLRTRLPIQHGLESLEDRKLPVTFTVSNLLDNGSNGSLRWAVGQANDTQGADDIVFQSGLTGTITLGGTSIELTDTTGATTITGPGADLLTIDGGWDGVNSLNNNTGSQIFSIGTGVTAELVGLTLTRGNASGSGVSLSNGGAIVSYGNLTVRQSVIHGNRTNNTGGGISSLGSGSTVAVIESRISGNSASTGGGIFGQGSITVTQSMVSGNTTRNFGGGIHGAGLVTVRESTVSGNTADGGGGIEANTVFITQSTISGNTARTASGGGIHASTVTVTQSTVSGNTASSTSGGGISAGILIVTQSTVSGNTARSGNGGGIDASTVTVTQSTVSGNSALFSGGGIIARTLVTASNSLIVGNTAPTGADVMGTFSASGSLIGLPSGITLGQILQVDGNGKPLLANNGGPTQTIALVAGSPAINAGLLANIPADADDLDGDSHVTEPVPFDQRGMHFTRQNGAVDIGAYEAQSLSLVVDTAVDENDGNYAAGDLSLREAISLANANPEVDTITFDAGLQGTTITLSDGWNNSSDDTALRVSDSLIIDGGTGVVLNMGTTGRRHLVNDSGSTLTLQNLSFTGGDLTGVGDGGAILNSGILTVDRSTFSGNQANNGGAIGNLGSLTVTNSTFNGNSATTEGGAIHSAVGSTLFDMRNATLVGNSANVGSAVGTAATTSFIAASTIVDNVAGSANGTISVFETLLDLENTVIARNTNDGAITSAGNGTGTLGGVNNVLGNGTWTGINPNQNFNNRLGVTNLGLAANLAHNGGPTQTVAVLSGSLLVNPPVNPGVVPTTDQRGIARDARPDIGAVEYTAFNPSLAFVVTTAIDEDNGTTDPAFGTGISLREAIQLANTHAGADFITFGDGSATGGTNFLDAISDTITLNRALGFSGALYVNDSTGLTTVTGTGVNRLTINGAGGDIFRVGESAELTGMTMSNGSNAVVVNSGASATIRQVLISGGGAGVAVDGSATISDSTLTGQIFGLSVGGSVVVNQSTITGAKIAGVNVFSYSNGNVVGNATIRQSSILGTVVGSNLYAADSTITLENSLIVGGNTELETAGTGTITDLGGNLIGLPNGFTLGQIIAVDGNNKPLLANNGGPVPTVALVLGSPAINAGNNAAAVDANNQPLTTDQRGTGYPRVVGAKVDAGAFEFPNSPPTNISLTNNTIAENAGVNAVVGALSATDPDSGETFTFSLPNGVSDNSLFNISGTSLRANSSFNFEASQYVFTVRVRVTDSGNNTFDKPFTITVTDVPESPEQLIFTFLSGSSIDLTSVNGRISSTQRYANVPTLYEFKQTAPTMVFQTTAASNLVTLYNAIPNDNRSQLIVNSLTHIVFSTANVQSLVFHGGSGNDFFSLTGVDGLFTGTLTVNAGDGNDFVSATSIPVAMIVNGGDGNDSIYAGSNNDTVNGGGGTDLIQSYAGNDSITAGDGNDTVYSGAGADNVSGDAGFDLIYADAGNDVISGGAGNDTVYAGADQDVVSGDADQDSLFGESGNDSLDGGEGNDSLDGGMGNDSLLGGNGHDTLNGASGNDIADGGAGNDQISNGSGRNILIGGTGADRIVGGSDDDILIAGYVQAASPAALNTLLSNVRAAWTAGTPYSSRVTSVAALLKASGPSQNVFDDAATDTLTGKAGQDLFFAKLTEVTDKANNESLFTI